MYKRVLIAITISLSLAACSGSGDGNAPLATDVTDDATAAVGDAVDAAAETAENAVETVATATEGVVDPAAADAAWQPIEGNWDQAMGSVKERWVELTDDDLLALSGDKDQFVSLIEQKYGIPREEAEQQVNEWASAF